MLDFCLFDCLFLQFLIFIFIFIVISIHCICSLEVQGIEMNAVLTKGKRQAPNTFYFPVSSLSLSLCPLTFDWCSHA